MKAPDKIYIQINDKFNSIYPTFSREPRKFPPYRDVEYICKNALLECLEDELKHLENGGIASKIGAMTIREVINKINSL